jgi:hypothetical protein
MGRARLRALGEVVGVVVATLAAIRIVFAVLGG